VVLKHLRCKRAKHRRHCVRRGRHARSHARGAHAASNGWSFVEAEAVSFNGSASTIDYWLIYVDGDFVDYSYAREYGGNGLAYALGIEYCVNTDTDVWYEYYSGQWYQLAS
jgi:hypothetical protein